MKKNKVFLFGLAASLITAAVPVYYVINCLKNSYVLSEFMLACLAVPLLLSLLVVFIKRIPDVLRAIIPVLMLVLVLVGFVFLNSIGGHIEFRAFANEAQINSYYASFDYSRYGEYETIRSYKYHSTGIFQQLAYTTVAEYNEANFEKEKDKIVSDNEFYIDKNFIADGFDFKIKTSDNYPKELELIGINNETREIAYVKFFDYDLDSMEESQEFLNSNCGWQYVTKERK